MLTSRIRGGACLVACCVTAAAAVSSPAQQPVALLVPGNAIVLGRVVEAGTTTAVSDAMVTLSSSALGASNATFSNGTPGGERRVLADGQGRFVFRELPAGTYSIRVTAAGYVDGAYGETRPIAIRRTLDISRTLELTDADRPANVTIQLWKLGGFSGAVTDDLGEPVVSAVVSVFARMTDWGGPITQPATTVLTDDRGMYHVDLVPGDYIAGVLSATTTIPAAASEAFQQAQREGGATFDAYMRQVVASGGLLPRGYGVRLRNLVVSQLNERNTFAVPPPHVRDGRWMFYPSAFYANGTSSGSATIVSIGSGEEKPSVDISIKATPMLTVSGRVDGPNGPARGITLQLIGSDPAVARTTPARVIDPTQAVSDGDGSFVFVGVAPGAYTLKVLRLPASATDPVLWSAEPLSVGDADVTDVRVQLQTGARVSGHVVVEGTKPLAPGALRGITIVPRPVPGSAGAFQQQVASERLDESNGFTTRQVIPGPYMMTVFNIPSGWALKTATVGGANVVDRQFELPSSGIDDMVVTISDKISSLSGFVRAENGQPAPTASVAVFPTDKALWRSAGMASRRVQVIAPARNGRFEFRGLPAGEYFVVGADWPGADFSDGQVLTKLMPSASRVVLSDGEVKTQDLRVVVVK